MSILNPIKFCLISFISLLTFPLAILAGLTTALAFSILLFRVSMVYVDFLVSFIPTYVLGRHTYSRRLRKKPSPILADPDSPSANSYARRRRRRLSAASAEPPTPTLVADQHGLGLFSAGMDRDFEGLGGWRDGDDELWTNINSRFRLSEGRPEQGQGQNHHRTLSGSGIPREKSGRGGKQGARSPGSTTPVSPNMSKVRRPAPPNGVPPPFTAVGEDTFR